MLSDVGDGMLLIKNEYTKTAPKILDLLSTSLYSTWGCLSMIKIMWPDPVSFDLRKHLEVSTKKEGRDW